MLLESDGYEVFAARNGSVGLTVFHRSLRPIDLLVTDCNMPGMTGMELAHACARRNRDVAVLYMSGSVPDEELQADLETRKCAFLSKPFRGDDLLHKAKELLAPGCGRAALHPPLKLQLAVQLTRCT
jgi:CheY-like chemotaxis protein